MYMCAMAIDFTSVPTISSHSIFKIFAMMRRFLFYILLVYVQLQRGTFLIIEKSEMSA